MHFPIETFKLNPNPNRDFNFNPIIESKKKELKTSINKSGFWENTPAALIEKSPIPPELEGFGKTWKEIIPAIELLPPEKQLELSYFVPVCLGNGHHRIAAAVEAGVKTANFKVIFADEELLLHLFAEENADTYGGSLLTNIESVRKYKDMIERQMEESVDFEEYKAKGFRAIKTAKGYSQVQAQGVGHATVAKAMGWNANKVRAAFNGIALLESNLVSGEEIEQFTSADQMATFSRLVTEIMSCPDYPPEFNAYLAEQCKAVVLKDKTSGKTITAATREFKENRRNPIEYLKAMRPVDIGKLVMKWITDGLRQDMDINGPPSFMELVDKAKETLAKTIEREKREANKEAEREKAVKDLVEAGMDRDKAIEQVAAEAATEPPEDGGGAFGGEDDGAPKTVNTADMVDNSPAAIATYAGIALKTNATELNKVLEVADELSPEANASFFEASENTFRVLTDVLIRTIGLKKVRAIVSEVSKG